MTDDDSIARLQRRIDDLTERLDALETTVDATGPSERRTRLTRRTLLGSTGLLGAVGLATGTAAADAQGQVGTDSDPVATIYAQSINASTDAGLTFNADGSVTTLLLKPGSTDVSDAGSSVTAPNIVGGHPDNNTASASPKGATIGGGGTSGSPNETSDDYATVGGGKGNTASYNAATVGGGQSNSASGRSSTVAGGDGNSASGSSATAGGGLNNTVGGNYATVSGGDNNSASQGGATVGGGLSNTASGDESTVGGGDNNKAKKQDATIAGGSNNTASGGDSTVGGGSYNKAAATFSTIAGGGPSNTNDNTGTRNVIYDNYGSIGGGGNNQAGSNDNTSNDTYATVPGGRNNTADGAYSFVAGRAAKANGNDGAFVWGDSTSTSASGGATDEVRFQATGGFVIAPESDSTTMLDVQDKGGNSVLAADTSNQKVQVFDGDASDSVDVSHGGTDGSISTSTGDLQLNPSGSVTLNGNGITQVGGTTDASAGGIKLANGIAINWRDSGDATDYGITLDSNNVLQMNANSVGLSAELDSNATTTDLDPGTVYFALDTTNDDAKLYVNDHDGATGTLTVGTYSTERLKADIEPFTADPARVLDVRAQTFTKGNGDGEDRLGLTAERAHDAGLDWLVEYTPVEDAWQTDDGISEAYIEEYGVERDGETVVPDDVHDRAWLALHHELLRTLEAETDGIADNEERIADIEAELETQDARIEGQQDRIEELESTVENESVTIDTVREALDDKTDRIEELEAETESLREENDALRSENETLRAENDRLRERVATIEAHLGLDGGDDAAVADD